MSWVRVDDKIAFHRKVVDAGNEAFGAWMRMTAWTADHLLDGRIPRGIAWAICGHGRECVLDRLVEVGLLERDGDDFLVHDYCQYNPLAADVKAKRQADLDRKNKKKNGKNKPKTSARIPNGITTDSNAPVPDPLLSFSFDSSVPSSSVSDACARVNALDLGEPENAKQRRIVDKHLPDALKILSELNAARSRVRPSSRGIRPTYSSLGGIAARLAAGRTVEECLTVVALGEAECARKEESFDYLDAISPWRPENFERRIARDPKGEAKKGNHAPTANFTESGDKTAEYT